MVLNLFPKKMCSKIYNITNEIDYEPPCYDIYRPVNRTRQRYITVLEE